MDQLEHLRLVEQTKRVVVSEAARGDVWHTGSHAEHAKPMLEVAGPFFLRSLVSALVSSADAAASERAVRCIATCVGLSAFFGLDAICGQCVGALAQASAVQNPQALLRASESIEWMHS